MPIADFRPCERALQRAGITGIAISNVSSGTASGSAALLHARQALLSGEAQCVLAFGFGQVDDDSALEQAELLRLYAAQLECMADRISISDEAFARVAVKARAHAVHNPYAMHRDPLSLEEALAALTLGGRLLQRVRQRAELRCGRCRAVHGPVRRPPWAAR